MKKLGLLLLTLLLVVSCGRDPKGTVDKRQLPTWR